MIDLNEPRKAFWRDGAVCIPRLLDPAWMDLAERAIARGRKQPGPYADLKLFEGTEREFWVDICNFQSNPELQMLVQHSPLVDVAAGLLQTRELFLGYDEFFVKEASNRTKSTPFHQDTTYWPMKGRQAVVAWITIEPHDADESLEFVRGTHVGPTYNGSDLGGDDDTEGFQPGDALPRIPDIANDRARFDLFSFAHQRGDVVMFHPNILHGGGAPSEAHGRHTVALKFFGDDFVFDPKPVPMPPFPGAAAFCRPGEPMRTPWNPRVFPRASAPAA